MRLLGRLLLFGILMALSLWGGRALWLKISAGLPQPRAAADAQVRTLYRLEPRDWTEFSLPGGSGLLRLVSNAELDPGSESAGLEGVAYSLDYQVLAADGRVLAEHTYHQRSRLVRLLDPQTGEPTAPLYYPDSALLPAEGRIALIGLQGLEGAAALRVRPGPADPAVAGVGLRVYALEQAAEHKLGFLWQRLSQAQKQSLARGSVYPPELLLAEEKLNLLRQGWRPLGPAGVAGQDYHPQLIYLRQGAEGEQFEEVVLPQGLVVDTGRRGVIALPEDAKHLQLQLRPLVPGAKGEGPVRLRWFGRGPDQRRQFAVPWPAEPGVFEADLGGGLLEVESPSPLAVRAFLREPDLLREVTPEPLYHRSYLVDSGQPVAYRVSHDRAAATPFRVDLRLALPLAEPWSVQQAPVVGYRLLDAKGETLTRGDIPLAPIPSLYDSPAGLGEGGSLSEPLRSYFRLGPEVAEIRFEAPAPALVSAYTRPPGLARELRIPEDYFAPSAGEERQPAWFGLRPEDHEGLERAGRSLLLTVQHRPPEERPELLEGRYLWEDFHPEGDWLARRLLVPAEPGSLQRDAALPATFRPLHAGRETRLSFRSPYRRPTVEPTLLFLRSSDRPLPFALYVDGLLHQQGVLAGREGELRLAPVAAGVHRLRLEVAEPGRYLVNFADGAGAAFRRRLANRIGREPLSFTIERGGAEETLSVRFFAPAGQVGRTRLRVTLEGRGKGASTPTADWTFGLRRFDLLPPSGEAVPVLASGGESVDQGQAFFIPLGRDLPPGPLRVRISLEDGAPGYLLLSRLTPGDHAERALLRERDWVREAGDD
ncbi:hypothetical protein DESUT3_39410 [Desulfuromonas versatilis]|uniref:Uncharacterized protein n=1 Tax=Desulfuromonas versatilis TaxID=2802975 RepID=A0ABM8HY17_9BACT|nr:hypothetical protein [Desulfuromonas versatilis]BCR06872.1 hypothetical protein DESUT3_39410 [Desulfuromonas versatilis]